VNLKSTFNEYLNNPALVKEHTIRIDASAGESLMKKEGAAGQTSSSLGDDMISVRSGASTLKDGDSTGADDINYNQIRLF
jgi:hypothetical protein